jgi:inner membrane protein
VDNVTHSLFGLTLARTPLGRAGKGATVALLLASNAPDIDIVATAGGATKYLEWHRGMTHGPLGWVGLAFVTAAIVAGGRRLNPKWRDEDADASFAMLASVSLVGILFHVLMDLPTSYGIRLFSPFDWHWYALDWLPIVDVYLLVVLAAGLFFGRKTDEARRRNASIVLSLTAAIYAVHGVAHDRAMTLAPRLFGPTLPQPCGGLPPPAALLDRWPRAGVEPVVPPGRRCLIEIAAIPNFSAPFSWKVVAQLSNAFEIHDLDLLDGRFRGPAGENEVFWRQAVRYPNVWTPLVTQAAGSHVGRVFLGFSRFAAARSAIDGQGNTTVRFTDVRFVNGPAAFGENVQAVRPGGLFTAFVQLDPSGHVLSQGFASPTPSRSR